MTDMIGHSPNGMGLANTAVLAALIDHLITKDVIGLEDAVSILDAAYSELAPNQSITSAMDAMAIIRKLRVSYAK
jgi:hypothetical protein